MSASSTQAAVASARARRAECLFVTDRFDNVGSTVEQKQEYASCIGVLHPQPISAEGIGWIKAAIVLTLVFIVVGAVKGYRDYDTCGFGSRIGNISAYTFLYLCCGWGTVGSAAALYWGIKFLVQA